ncbi:MAG TPA: AraC family transcriptional regulator [Ignavibacteriaceae bacterium]|nr:AraC family transcriptional regulator [Ignavibacteriaceae bacterium]
MNVHLLKNFFHTRLNTLIIVFSILLCISIYLYFSSFHKVIIFPGRDYSNFEFYADKANGGNSVILQHSISDSIINLDFKLNEGFVSPYVGINITNKKENFFNLASYNRLNLEVAGEEVKSIGFSIYADNAYNNKNIKEKEVCFYQNLDIKPERKDYVLNLNELKVADWWIAVNNIPADEKFEPDLKKVYRVNIGTAYGSASNVKRSLYIYSILFERDNTGLLLFLISSELILIFLLVVIRYLRSYYRKSPPVTITYKPVDIENETRQINSFFHYINNNFHDHNLTLKQVSSQTGINERRITASIQETFGCNFKTYVNRIRINESKRLLVESELNMGEIAFKVGFSNQTHFNRVFKNFEGISPSEFLENNNHS